MQIRTMATFLDEEKKEIIEGGYIFDLFDVCDANESEGGYTCITISSTGNRSEIKIKFETFWKIMEDNYIKTKTIVE